jgi:hypothetical protein
VISNIKLVLDKLDVLEQFDGVFIELAEIEP